MFDFFHPTEWQFVTSGGAEITFGLSKFLFAGATAGAFYVRKPQSPIYRLPYGGAVGGAGVGLSAAGPVSVSVSLPWAPGGGFRIYRNPIRGGKLKLEDFTGSFAAIQISGGGGLYNRSRTLVIFGAPSWLVNTVLAPAQFPALAAACQGMGVLWGSAVSNAAGVSVEVLRGEIVATARAEDGETGS